MQLHPGTPEEAGMSAKRIHQIAALAQGWVAQGLTPALVVLVARRGVIVLHEAFGRLTPEPGAPPLPRDTLFPLTSMTKTLTATVAMLLVEDGLLGLNRPVYTYIPEFAGGGKEAVQVHHLLTHTSGIWQEDLEVHVQQRWGIVATPPPEATQHPFIQAYLQLGYDVPPRKAPGLEMSYCDFGFEVLGEIIRRVSGQALADFAQVRLFAPLGMQDTYYSVPSALSYRVVKRPPDAPFAEPTSPGLAEATSFRRARMIGLNSRELQERPFATGGAFSTALDMAVFGQMLLNGGCSGATRILSAPTVAVMTRNQIPGISAAYDDQSFPEASWGLGWDIHGQKKALYDGTLHSPQAFAHGGGGGVYLWVDPLYEIVGAYFSVLLQHEANGNPLWTADLFTNAVTAAVDD